MNHEHDRREGSSKSEETDEKTSAHRLLNTYGLLGFDDTRRFCKDDLRKLDTVGRLADPNVCTETQAVSLLKHFVRDNGYKLMSRERNIGGKKTVFYQIMSKECADRQNQVVKERDTDRGFVKFET